MSTYKQYKVVIYFDNDIAKTVIVKSTTLGRITKAFEEKQTYFHLMDGGKEGNATWMDMSKVCCIAVVESWEPATRKITGTSKIAKGE